MPLEITVTLSEAVLEAIAAKVADRLADEGAQQWMTVGEAAAYLRVGPQTIREAALSGELQNVTRGDGPRPRRLFKQAWLDEWLRRAG